MAKYYHTDYALNKKSDSILYHMADGTVVEITKEDYLKASPDLTEEDFKAFKEVSDEMFKDEKNLERTQERTKSKEKKKHRSTPTPLSQEEQLIDSEEKQHIREVANKLLASGKLSEKQKRRFVEHYSKGKSTRQIAKEEGVSQRAIWDSLFWARKKLKKFFAE